MLVVGDHQLVSNMGPRLDPLARDGDGFIRELDARGEVGRFGPLDAPKGMTVIYRIASDGTRSTVGPRGLFDGVAIDDDGAILVSDWVSLSAPAPGRVLRIVDGVVHEIALPEPMHGPADFAHDRGHHQLWIPRSLDQRVTIVPLCSERGWQIL